MWNLLIIREATRNLFTAARSVARRDISNYATFSHKEWLSESRKLRESRERIDPYFALKSKYIKLARHSSYIFKLI